MDGFNTDEFQSIRDLAHDTARSKGFWGKDRDSAELLMLIIGELGEAQEAHRKGLFSDWAGFDGSSLEFLEAFELHIKDTFEDELGDVCLRILDLMGAMAWSVDIVKVDMGLWSLGKRLLFVADHVIRVSRLIPGRLGRAVFDISGEFVDARDNLNKALSGVVAIADIYDVDLLRGVRMKLKYNDKRPRLHGKRY